MSADLLGNRLAVFVKLAESANGNLGRTSLMKLCYFLQALRRVPLAYNFSLYSYGPFDSDVLSDLQTAEGVGILHTDVEYYSGGYKYDIRPGDKGENAKEFARNFIAECKEDIDWVSKNFGGRTAAELELLSTIVFVNEDEGIRDRGELMERVKLIKPHFSDNLIEKQVEWLDSKNLLN